jgi:membrane-bound metal-dependent hydrolase YbcI (DUF457 family)
MALLAAVALLPDLDFLLGVHSRQTHSLGAVLAAGAVAWLLGGRRPRWALAVAAAYASHLLLDWLGTDTTPPIGIMALWPLSGVFVQSDLHLFMATSRDYWLNGFWSHNLTAVLREIAILGPPTLALWWWRSPRRAPSGSPSGTGAN